MGADYKTVPQQLREVEEMAQAESPMKVKPQAAVVEVAPGVVVPMGAKPVTAQEVSDMIRGVAGKMYDGQDPQKRGMTLIEAALFEAAKQAADGDGDSLDRLLNRLLGKPLQQVASISTTATLKEFLDNIIRAEGRPVPVETTAVVEKEEELFS